MKTNSFPPLILLFLLFISISCGDKESKVVPTFLDIEEFVVDKTIRAELVHNHSNYALENKIIVTLPPNYTFDYIIPSIKSHKYTAQISPQSGQKIAFEEKSPITYTLTGKNGLTTKYNLYVRRTGAFKVSVTSTDFQLDKVAGQYFRVKLPTIGTSDNTRIYEAVFYDENDNQRYIVSDNGQTSNISFSLPKYFKSGKYKVKIIVRDIDQLNSSLRESESILINFIKSKVSTILTPEPLILKGQKFTIRGYGFADDKQYKLRIKNDFITSPFDIIGQYIDETQINFLLPDNLDEVDYEAAFLENDIRKEVSLLNNTMFLTKDKANSSLLTLFEVSKAGHTNIEKPIYTKGESINTPYFFRNPSTPYNLLLTHLTTEEEYIILGKDTYYNPTFSYFLSFAIPSTIPAGVYSVQGLKDGQRTTRYWKKIEIK